jgi:hypothetical protein
VLERQLSLYQLEPGTRPARVAVVGAGPAGLWIAVLLAREHVCLFLFSLVFSLLFFSPLIFCPPSFFLLLGLPSRHRDGGIVPHAICSPCNLLRLPSRNTEGQRG